MPLITLTDGPDVLPIDAAANTGADTIQALAGDDYVFGGFGNDVLYGDEGNDTERGGPGADVFQSFGDAGLDRVLDFNAGEGDRVRLDPGSSYAVSQ